jgi:hypothetical protein
MNRCAFYGAMSIFLILTSSGVWAYQNEPLWQDITIWSDARTLMILDFQGNVLDEIDLPTEENYLFWAIGASHNGEFVAYTSVDRANAKLRLKVLNIRTQSLLIDREIPLDGAFWQLDLIRSRNFSLDNTAFAYGYYFPNEAGWQIDVFDLQTGEITVSLTQPEATQSPFVGLQGQSPLIYHFEADVLTLVTSNVFNAPHSAETAVFDSVDWNIRENIVSDNCNYSHLAQDTFNPTGEMVEVAENRVQIIPFSSPGYNERQIIFYTDADFVFNRVSFIQNGEAVAAWGYNKQSRQPEIFVIARDGTLLDHIEVVGLIYLQATKDGFLYTDWYDVSGETTEITYVNTRELSHTLIWSGEPNQSYFPVWTDNYEEDLTAIYLEWANLETYSAAVCHPNRG